MYLKQLTLSGFKSFARKTTLKFTSGITAIVGPNGSGKSNLADAIRWVMGEQSIKTLRGKRAEDVIFSGSDKKTRLGLAEASLYLDNHDKRIPLDYSELIITRRIYRNGESNYLINSSKSKLADINLLLSGANFGHHSYSIIGQGAIDNFLLSSPEQRKEFFEEATGVRPHQIKKNQALHKLESAWRNLITLKIKISEMEPRLRLLVRQVKKLNRRKEIEKELQETKITYYSSFWQEIDSKYSKEKSEIDKLSSEKDRIYSRWKNLEAKLNQLSQENSFAYKVNKLRLEEQKTLNKKIELKEKLIALRIAEAHQIKENIPQIKKISNQELAQFNKKIKEIDALHKKLIELVDQETSKELIKKEIFKINKKIDGLLVFLKPYLELAQKTQLSASVKTSQEQEEIKKIENQVSEINQGLNTIQENIKEAQEKDSESRSSLWRIQKEFQSAQVELNKINNEVNESRIDLARTETRRFDLRQEINYQLGGLEGLKNDTRAPLPEQEKINYQNKINHLKNQLEIIGGLDPELEAEYTATQERYNFLTSQTNDLTKTSHSLKRLVDELNEIIKKQINKSFQEINKNFQKYFKFLFSGGQAELILLKEEQSQKKTLDTEDEDEKKDPVFAFLSEKTRVAGFSGIEVRATPPGKRLKTISALSGGERSLTNIALICAIISSNPSPFIVLDEVDAALDESNSIRFAEILANLSHKTQFIIITHNRATIEKSNIIYGVTMGDDGISKLLSIKLDEVEKYKKQSSINHGLVH